MQGVFSVDVESDLNSKESFRGVSEGIPLLASLLNKHGIKGTFFVTGEVLEKYPKIFIGLEKSGHEIALHSYDHKRYDSMSRHEKVKDIKKMLSVYRNIFHKNPKGFRAPQHSIDSETISLLEDYGFVYDSSKTPFNAMLFRHLLMNNSKKLEVFKNFFSKYWPHQIGKKLYEIPRTSFLLATGGFELKIYPKQTHLCIMKLSKCLGIPFIFVMHSWDMINIPKSRITRICSKKDFYKKLDMFLNDARKIIKFTTMSNLVK